MKRRRTIISSYTLPRVNTGPLNSITALQRTILNEANIEQRTSDPRARPQSSPLGPVFFTGSRARRHIPIPLYTKTGDETRICREKYTHTRSSDRKSKPSTINPSAIPHRGYFNCNRDTTSSVTGNLTKRPRNHWFHPRCRIFVYRDLSPPTKFCRVGNRSSAFCARDVFFLQEGRYWYGFGTP